MTIHFCIGSPCPLCTPPPPPSYPYAAPAAGKGEISVSFESELQHQLKAMNRSLSDLREENERLRKALTKIADSTELCHVMLEYVPTSEATIAIEALNGDVGGSSNG